MVEDIRDLDDCEGLSLPCSRPHHRELRFGTAAGYWVVAPSGGIHLHDAFRAIALPLGGDVMACRPALGSTAMVSWAVDARMAVHIVEDIEGRRRGSLGPSALSMQRTRSLL